MSKPEEKIETTEIPQGKQVSGRTWKQPKTKASNLNQVKALHISWEERQRKRQHDKVLKALSDQIKAEDEKVKTAEKRASEQRRKQKAENEKRGEVVQVVKGSTIKRANKKGLKSFSVR
eukprot:TRINITY_DN882_c0_g1_i1.p1 TRINITY_DN882_c0_g1~~TRINITY_DN882_c0_g1_i1.p1  ORF type:complete len:119 (-),score=11.73 TRINITY_DN882_c0_g1_i1:49-405(-)